MRRLAVVASCLGLARLAKAGALAPEMKVTGDASRPGSGFSLPAAETVGAGVDQNRMGWSPRPTPAPAPYRFGEMELARRNEFTMGTGTCGFLAGLSSWPVTCLRVGAYCTNDGAGNMDCCEGAYSSCVKTMYSACLDYSASRQGACDGAGPRTICCFSASPSCFTMLFSTTASPNTLFSIFQCQTVGGISSLLATPPAFSLTANPGSSESSSPTPSSSSRSSSGAAPAPPSTDRSSVPVGAIVGGAVGGAAVLGIAAFLIAILVIRNRKKKPPTTGMAAQSDAPQKGQEGGQNAPELSQFPQQAGPYKPYTQSVAQETQYEQLGQRPGYASHTGYQGSGPYDPMIVGSMNAPPPSTMSPSAYSQSTLHHSYGQGTPPAMGQGYAGQGQMPGPMATELPVQGPLGTDGRRAELGS